MSNSIDRLTKALGVTEAYKQNQNQPKPKVAAAETEAVKQQTPETKDAVRLSLSSKSEESQSAVENKEDKFARLKSEVDSGEYLKKTDMKDVAGALAAELGMV